MNTYSGLWRMIGALAVSCLTFLPVSYANPSPASIEDAPTSSSAPRPSSAQQQTRQPDVVDTSTVTLGGDDERLRPGVLRQYAVGNAMVSVTGAFRWNTEFQDNFNLRSAKDEDRLDVEPIVNMNFIVDFPNRITLFTEFRLENRVRFEERSKPMNRFQMQVRDFFANIPLRLPVPTVARIGRQQLFERRRWYLNNRADALRLLFDWQPLDVDVSVLTPVPDTGQSIRVFDNVFQRRRQFDMIVNVAYALTDSSSIGGYVIVGKNHRNLLASGNPRQEDPIWVGLRLFGKEKVKWKLGQSDFVKQWLRPKIRYWLDAAWVTGEVGSQRLNGVGVDMGATYIARKFPMKPYVTVAYAIGTGDGDPGDGTDHHFRQTGFHTNSGKFGGVVNLDYYGVLFDPELSNLQVFTAGVGIRPTPKSSIDLIYHHYTQHRAWDEFRDAEVDDPAGTSRDIGDELDLVLGYREIKDVRFRLRTGYFLPGNGYRRGRDDPAFLAKFDVQISF